MTRCAFTRCAVASLVIALLAAAQTSAADSGRVGRQILKPPSGAHKLAKRCAPGFRLFGNQQSSTYGCVFGDVAAVCRRKYEFTPQPYVAPAGTAIRFIYSCSKARPGNSAPTTQDCASRFRKTAEVPNQGYRCYLPFKPSCQAGFEPGQPLVHRSGSEISVRYYCKKKPASSSGIEPVDRMP